MIYFTAGSPGFSSPACEQQQPQPHVAARCQCSQSSRNGSEDSELSDKAEERVSTASMRGVSQGFESGRESGILGAGDGECE